MKITEPTLVVTGAREDLPELLFQAVKDWGWPEFSKDCRDKLIVTQVWFNTRLRDGVEDSDGWRHGVRVHQLVEDPPSYGVYVVPQGFAWNFERWAYEKEFADLELHWWPLFMDSLPTISEDFTPEVPDAGLSDIPMLKWLHTQFTAPGVSRYNLAPVLIFPAKGRSGCFFGATNEHSAAFFYSSYSRTDRPFLFQVADKRADWWKEMARFGFQVEAEHVGEGRYPNVRQIIPDKQLKYTPPREFVLDPRELVKWAGPDKERGDSLRVLMTGGMAPLVLESDCGLFGVSVIYRWEWRNNKFWLEREKGV